MKEDERAFRVVELTSEVVAEALELLRRHPLRAADALQLASVLVVGRALGETVPLLAFDEALLIAARAEAVPLHA